MIRLTQPPALSPALEAEFAPSVWSALVERGVLDSLPQEGDIERRDRRLETELMRLFRDTRMEAAFETLYLRSRSMMLSWILHLTRNRPEEADPAELLQDTFVNIYRYARGFSTRKGNSFRGWARTIAANVVRRSRMKRAMHSLGALPYGLQEPADVAAGPMDAASSDEQMESYRRAWLLLLLHYAQAYEKLAERDREALHMVEVEGVSYADAGKRLRVGRSNMKMIMFRSRKRIRAHIARAMGNWPEESSVLPLRAAS